MAGALLGEGALVIGQSVHGLGVSQQPEHPESLGCILAHYRTGDGLVVSQQRRRIRSYGWGSFPTICSTLSRRSSARRGSPQRSSAAAITSNVAIASR